MAFCRIEDRMVGNWIEKLASTWHRETPNDIGRCNVPVMVRHFPKYWFRRKALKAKVTVIHQSLHRDWYMRNVAEDMFFSSICWCFIFVESMNFTRNSYQIDSKWLTLSSSSSCSEWMGDSRREKYIKFINQFPGRLIPIAPQQLLTLSLRSHRCAGNVFAND